MERGERAPAAGFAGLLMWCVVVAALISAVTGTAIDTVPLRYPPAPAGTVVDDYHGTPVADPWRWLEDMGSADTRKWISAQNLLSERYIAQFSSRTRFARRLRALLNYERRGVPERENGVYVYSWNPGQAEQDVVKVTHDLGKPGRVLLDPLAMRADGTLSVADYRLSPDGSRLAYALSDGGSDWNTWLIRDVATTADEPWVLAGTKFTSVSWSRDGRGFYYSRYPGDDTRGYDDGRQVAVYFHVAGTPQSMDMPVYSIGDHPTRDPYATVSPDGRFLVLNIEDGYLSNALYYQRLDAAEPGSPVVKLIDTWDARYEFLGADGDSFYVLTTSEAQRGRVIAINLAAPGSRHWRTVVPESADVIEAAALIGGRLVVQYIHDVSARVRLYELDGTLVADVRLPGQGTVAGLRGVLADPEAFLSYTDFTTPRRVYRLDVRSAELSASGSGARLPDPGRYVSQQVFYSSRDGTKVPMTIVRRRDVHPDGRTPTVLYGYGGFNVSLLPAYSAARMAWIEAGGIYAQANLRGGGEYGEAWHVAGTRLSKQNVFDDFIAAAEWLVTNGVTSPGHLAIWGGSNGGLLVGAVLNQRPELFAAAVPSVGVLDMLRYHTSSLNARKWSSDYGLSEDPEEFSALHAYSPYHNVRTGLCYPAVLVLADTHDDRVAAWHSYKYTAALQAAQPGVAGCRRPVLLRVETRSGHGAGASLTKTISEYADQWAFVAAATGLQR
ncbi:MAG: prolyl oligopeptidase family serine peptidase [Gammaproteobacteria bacterium]|nr:prolyl oligopeptidase family serine peptidase [Gammaproteobacteria bacterium]